MAPHSNFLRKEWKLPTWDISTLGICLVRAGKNGTTFKLSTQRVEATNVGHFNAWHLPRSGWQKWHHIQTFYAKSGSYQRGTFQRLAFASFGLAKMAPHSNFLRKEWKLPTWDISTLGICLV